MGGEIVKVKEGLEQLVAKHNDALAATPRPATQQHAHVDASIKNAMGTVTYFSFFFSALCAFIGLASTVGSVVIGEPEVAKNITATAALPIGGWFLASAFPYIFLDQTTRVVKRLFPKWAKKKQRLHAMREIENNLDYKKKMAEHTAVYAKAQKELAPVLQELNTSALATMVNVEYVLTAKGVEVIPCNK